MTPTDPNSDYNTPSTDLFKLLPDPYQSDTNRAVFSNLFNRFLSKTETVHSVGYVGQGNTAALVSRQLKEPTVHRQAYQLQPILYNKIGSVEHITSWYDILNELTAQGVDVSRQGITAADPSSTYNGWASALAFNWVPPIDINKIVNYRDYYWYDPANPQSQPQYITVKSECSSAMALVSFYSSLIAQYGATFNIVSVIPSESKLVVAGNFTLLFAPDFIFYIQNSANTDLNNSFQRTVVSTYDATLDLTTIVVTSIFTDPAIGGQISLNQQLDIYQDIATCKCTGSVGWDILPWDDNPPLWNVGDLTNMAFAGTTPQLSLDAWNIAHPNLQAEWDAQFLPSPPPYPPLQPSYFIWWDTTSDVLYSLVDASNPGLLSSWKVLYFNFSLIEQQTIGAGYWDLSTGCADGPTVPGLDQWISENHWVHKADVPNFSIAKQAQNPIIEFEPNLELSEWTQTSYNWQYRANTQLPFTPTQAQPTRFELEPLNSYVATSSTITFDERFGDLTNIFVPGFKFLITGQAQQYTVVDSIFRRSIPANNQSAFETTVTVVEPLPVLNPVINSVYPSTTSQGDVFTSYGDQWLFDGINTTQAVNHQPLNNMMAPDVPGPIYPTYVTMLAPYAEQFDITAAGVTTLLFDVPPFVPLPAGSSRPLTRRALVGANDVRVYVNGIRQYGNYDELSEIDVDGTVWVSGIQFLLPLQTLDSVLVQVGESTLGDFGNYAVPVRTIVDDTEFLQAGPQPVSLIRLRLNEQVKTANNQYPLFDIYNTDSTSANVANPIFAYQESPTGTLFPYLGQRVQLAADGSVVFQNYLVQSNNGPLYAYRNYNKSISSYWYNTVTSTVLVWTGKTWSEKYETSSGYWLAPLVQDSLPLAPVAGLLVFNTTNNTLNEWTGSVWVDVPVLIATSDETLETNWRHGLNNEKFIAQQVDWQRRSYPEYTEQYNDYIDTTSAELIALDPNLTPAEAEAEANDIWVQIQDKSIVQSWYTDKSQPPAVTEGPIWIGNWQIPDPLYYNPEHEDWQYISATQLLTHFTTIVDAQPSYPGFGGQASANWRLIDYKNINWGLGGTIKEYDNSFDTFLSAEYIDTVTPPSLFDFAQNEYETIIVTLRDVLTRNFVAYMTNTDTTVILDPGAFAANNVINDYEENEAASLIYGDSTTYQQATDTTPARGIKNWIATLPYFGIVPKVVPYVYTDSKLGVMALMHHDGHRATYVIPPSIVNSLQQSIVKTPDPRAPGEKFGRVSNLQPPNTQTLFTTQFSSIYRNGVYWLNGPTLYRLAVANVGLTPPMIVVPVGSLWWDTTGSGTLKQQTAPNVWTPILGGFLYDGTTVETSTISAWEVVNLNAIYLDVLLDAETKLYEQAPLPPITPPIDFAAIEAEDPALYDQYVQQQFNTYCIDLQIATPQANNTYNAANPFTWNYKYSTPVTPPQLPPVTSPSGGCWQDVYEKTYGTPYPHLEPWVLQQYSDKPLWWDGVFANNIPSVYGNRRWKYIHGLPITTITPTFFDITGGDYTDAFNSFDTFTVYLTDDVTKAVFTVTSTAYNIGTNTTRVNVVESTAGITTGSLIAVGMWDYILRGIIPSGQSLPPNVISLPAYSYVSVNISQTTFVDGPNVFNADDLFPPYWNQAAHYPILTAIDLGVRSIFSNMSEITLENADYLWNDVGPVQWMWQQTTNYLYSLVTVAYLMEPVRVIQHIFGTRFNYINGLPIDSLTGEVFSHANTQFHGEITVNNQVVSVNGINQWYVNFNRANGFDASYSDFRSMWTAWTAPLSYLFGGFIDTESLDVDHRIVDITASDYEVTMKRSPGVINYWIDSFKIRITHVPPDYSLYNTQNEWRLELNTQAPISRTISYYDTKLYDFYADPLTSVCSLFTYPVVGVSTVQGSFVVSGDVTEVFSAPNGAEQFEVTGSNAGIYTVKTASFDIVTNTTTLVVLEPILSSASSSMLAAINYRTLPWNTGDVVSVASTELLPLPLDSTLQYFIIKLSPTTFQFAYNALDVIANTPILFTSQPMGIQRVGQLYNTFLALNGAHAKPTWTHYALDTSVVKTLTLPSTISGMQNFVNIMDGYSAYEKAQGFGINTSGAYDDPATGQPVSWQNEIERFIDWAYQQRSVRRSRMNDKYPVDVDYMTSSFEFTSQNPGYLTGDQVVVWSFQGGLPPPLTIGQIYYVINNSGGTISLASNYTNAISGIGLTINYIGGIGSVYISNAELYAAEMPIYEINPFRNALWFSPPFGILSNMIVGPFADILSTQLVFDQYGRRLSPADVRVFRQDKITQIQFAGGVYNDVNIIQNLQQNPYQYLHIGGANLYIDSYEHMLKFNDYTTAGALVYDPFLGLNVTKWELDFYKQDTFTERPNVGGYFLSQPYNQGANLDRNIEGSIEDLRYAYDPYSIPETLPAVKRSRALLGYDGVKDYLSQINLTAKSQFLFWKGAIHNKGSLNAVKAFVNSKRFINAQVDEYWAYKVADFGPVKVPEYLSMLLTIADTQTNELRLEYILNDQVCLPGYAQETFGNTDCGYANPPNASIVIDNVSPTFTAVSMTNESRWWNQPDQLQQLVPDGGVLYFDLKPKQKIVIYTTELNGTPGEFNPAGFEQSLVTDPNAVLFAGITAATLTNEIGVIAHDTGSFLNPIIAGEQHEYTFWTYNTAESKFDYAGGWDPNAIVPTLPILRHNFKADIVTATMNWYPTGANSEYVIPALPANTSQLVLTIPYLPLTNSLSVFKDGVELQVGVEYVESLELYMGSNILGYKLYFSAPISGTTIKVVYGPSQLTEDTQFTIVNSNIVTLLSQELVDNIFANDTTITLWGLTTDKEALNPAKIIDMKAQTVLTPVTYWDPARGYHYYEALHAIDLQGNADPAWYGPDDGGASGWKSLEAGLTWMDTTNVDYLPYYDTKVLPVEEDRFTDWGQLTDYGAIHVYQWTASPVPPDQYNAIAAVQESNSAIDPSIRLSGTVRQDVRQRSRVATTVTTITPAGITIVDPILFEPGMSVIFTTTGTIPDGIQPATPYVIATLVNNVVTLQGITTTTVGTGTLSMSGFQPNNWTPCVQQRVDLDASIDATFTGLTYEFTSDTIVNSFNVPGPVTFNVYVNGKTAQINYSTQVFGVITPGSLYTDGIYSDVPLVTLTGVGSGARANITVVGGVITDAAFVTPGSGYIVGDSVTVSVADVGGTGSGFSALIDSAGLVFPTTDVFPSLNPCDRVTLIIPVPVPVPFDPTVADDGSVQTQYEYNTNYVATQQFDVSTNASTYTYYFWVENKTTPTGTGVTIKESISEAAENVFAPPAPYMFFNKLLYPGLVANTETGETIHMPYRFAQAIIRGLRGYVNDENRYVLRYTRDFTLRDNLAFGTSPLQLKDAHQEWLMFREQQLNNVPLDLWNKITESMVGFLLSDPLTRVPSLARQLYDEAYGASTQYGFGVGQSFVNGTTAIATVLAYLEDPTNDFYPLDMDNFFATYNFDTPANCIATMNEIYNTFSYKHVNAIYFSVLQDALSVQQKYAGLMKTSAVALYGIELLDVNGAFDD